MTCDSVKTAECHPDRRVDKDVPPIPCAEAHLPRPRELLLRALPGLQVPGPVTRPGARPALFLDSRWSFMTTEPLPQESGSDRSEARAALTLQGRGGGRRAATSMRLVAYTRLVVYTPLSRARASSAVFLTVSPLPPPRPRSGVSSAGLLSPSRRWSPPSLPVLPPPDPTCPIGGPPRMASPDVRPAGPLQPTPARARSLLCAHPGVGWRAVSFFRRFCSCSTWIWVGKLWGIGETSSLLCACGWSGAHCPQPA